MSWNCQGLPASPVLFEEIGLRLGLAEVKEWLSGLNTPGFTFKRKGAEEGCSVIDYCLVSHEFLPSISRFEVGEFVDALSDHAPLWCSFCLAPSATSRAGAASATDRRPVIKWDNSESKREQYVTRLKECEPQRVALLEQLSIGVSLTVVADQW
eukprot:gene3747-4006_t